MTEFHFESVSHWKRKINSVRVRNAHFVWVSYQYDKISKRNTEKIWIIYSSQFDEHSWWQSKRRWRRPRRNAITVIWNSMKKWKQELITFHKLLLSYVHISGWISVVLSFCRFVCLLACLCAFVFLTFSIFTRWFRIIW